MYIECKQKILFQIDIENNIKFSSPKIKIKKEYSCLISMRTLVHALAHRSHSVSKLNLSFVRLAQCSLSPQNFRAADRTQDPQYMKYLTLQTCGKMTFSPTNGVTLPLFNIPCSSGAVYPRKNNNEAKARHMGSSSSGDEQ